MTNEELSIVINSSQPKELLSNLVDKANLQPSEIISFFDTFLSTLSSNNLLRKTFVEKISILFDKINIENLMTNSGIIAGNNIVGEFFNRMGELVLPQISDDNTLLSLMNDVLYSKKNYNLIRVIPSDRWEKLYQIILDEKPEITNKSVLINSLIETATIVIERTTGGAFDAELKKLYPNEPFNQNCFYQLSKIAWPILLQEDGFSPQNLERLKVRISQCKKQLDLIIHQKERKGISLKITIKITRIRQQLDRLLLILENIYAFENQPLNIALTKMTADCILFYSPQNKLSKQFSNTVYILTFLATFHNGKTGEKYITSTARQYFEMFYSAMGGGCIVAILCFFKLHFAHITESGKNPFLEAMLYSLNYAVGFTILYLVHFTLATKQPSMTASNLALVLKSKTKTEKNYLDFSKLFAKLFRSQFIAFMGNLSGVIPISMLIFYGLNYFNIFVLSPEKATKMFAETATFDWKIFWYGSIAGFFLFLSGLTSGLAINYFRYRNIYERLYHHPIYRKLLSSQKRKTIILWIENKIGGIVGSIVLGFLLGSAFLIFKIFAIPFDIRHITFAAGNLSIALSELQFTPDYLSIGLAFLAVLGIGWFNFIISFVFSLLLAMKSVDIPIRELGKITQSIVRYFFKNPLAFFIP